MKFVRIALLSSALLGGGWMNAATITADLFTPLAPSGSTPVLIDLSGITAPSQTVISGIGYTITFSGVPAGQGVVQGTVATLHATPVAGETGTTPEYLTGGFGTALTTNIGASGNYLSTDVGTITIMFSSPETSLALLWGSVDAGNLLTFNDVAGSTVTGAQVQSAAAGFVSTGAQGPGGSAYVLVNTSTPFTTVIASSANVSFEFGALAAAGTSPSGVPEPASPVLIGSGIGLMAAYGLRRRRA